MGEASYVQASFSGGLWSKSMQGRTDRPDYRSALNECLNSLPTEQGAWIRRPGTLFLGATRSGTPGRVIAFDFEQAAPYLTEWTDGFLRFWGGNQIVTTNDDAAITSISTANPAVVLLATAVTWATADQGVFKFLGATCPLLQHRTFSLTKVDTTHFSLTDAITGATIDGSTLGVGSLAAGATLARVLQFVSPYVTGNWAHTRLVQTDIPISQGTTPGAVVLNPTVAPYVIQVTAEPTTTAFATFSFAAASFKDGPYLDPFTNGVQANPNKNLGLVTITLTFPTYDATVAYPVGAFVTNLSVNYISIADQNINNTPAGAPTKWTPVSAGTAIGPNGFTGTDIGRMVRFLSEPPIWVVGTTYAAQAVVTYGSPPTYWTAMVGSNTGNIPGQDLTKWSVATNAFVWTWGKITSLSNQIAQGTGTAIGTLTAAGGVAASFDGVNSKTESLCSALVFTGTSGPTFAGYIGKHYGAGAQAIGSATIYPSSDAGFWIANSGSSTQFALTINLRGNASAPASSSDGTLLGTQAFANPNPINTTNPVTIVSTDQVTTWNYVWFEISVVFTGGFNINLQLNSSQVYFFNPSGNGVSTGVVVEILGDPLLYTAVIRTWRLGVYSDTTSWPTCGTYHEGRLWLSGVVPNRVDASKSNDIFNFAPTNPDGSIGDNNAISYRFNSPDVNPIFWMAPDAQGIVCGTQAGEWLIQATTQNLPLTPRTVQAHRHTRNGCANIEPRHTDHTLAVVQRFGRMILEYFADVFSGKFVAQDIVHKAKHLTKTFIREIAYQQELVSVVWARLGDGSLTGVTYKRDSLVSSQEATVAAAHRHTLGSGRTIESITVGPSPDGNLDALAMVTNDATSSIRHVEVMAKAWEEGDALSSAWLLDDAIQPTSTATTSVASAGAPYGGMTLYGLWHLNGQVVSVFSGGLDCGDFSVAAGTTFIPYGDSISGGTASGQFTAASAEIAAAAGTIVVGFTYTSDGQIVRPNSPQETGARNGPGAGKIKRSHWYHINVFDSAGMSIGTDFAKLMPILFKNVVGQNQGVGATYTGIYRETLGDDYSLDSMICWRITRPLPANIASLGGFIKTQDI